KTKDEFIENISNFVENDLLNEETLKKRIFQKEFKEAIYQMVKYFFTESLENHFQELKMEKVPGIKLSTANLLSYLKEKSPIYSQEILELILPEFKFKEII